jgi:ribonuclease HII
VPTLQIEAQHKGIVGGVDEVGRGPWAGPVVVGVAVFCSPLPSFLSDTIQDSKKLSKSKRDSIYKNLLNLEDFYYGVGVASVEEIDQLNILRATFLAMERAVQSLPEKPHVLLIDGKFIPSFEGIETYPVIKGDSLSLSIAAASILAKVTRDKMMEALAEEYPHYGWERNAGYGTAEHHHALKIHGITPHHRRSFAPIRNLCN